MLATGSTLRQQKCTHGESERRKKRHYTNGSNKQGGEILLISNKIDKHYYKETKEHHVEMKRLA